ncbi:MAG TPA: FtsX-like permease family protein [Noviherbaspirillum sp.]|uniref:ABC transporter permease n=1 Tax=Noviherbaspirillum sp. TaxID=1926288 RepID=UPI002B4A842A|nr:FtsX-like permease family protein [Noviherbaspirillum sp.]HJV85126.1 FtsX-like permease family protein [Noviherbaspirillum sp.]
MVKLALHPMDRKLLRDLWRMRGQALAIALVAMCGIATLVTMRGSYEALLTAQASYYEHYRFADVFATLKNAPVTLLARVREIPGVNETDGRVVFDASLDVPGLDEPAAGLLVSLPERPGTGLNRVHLRTGRLPEAGSLYEALISEAFSQANNLQPGDTLGAIINGRKEQLHIVGIAISPEFVNEIRGTSFPDNRRFGVMWMAREALAGAMDMRDSFNDLSVVLAPHASEQGVIDALDHLLAPYGSLGAYGRKDQVSHSFIDSELTQVRVSGSIIPGIFLGVAAFLIHNVLLRITSLQRAQIALLKSFGYSSMAVAAHFLKFALLTVMIGAILGIALGEWLGNGLADLYARFYHFPRMDFVLSGFAISVSLLVTALSAFIGAAVAVARVVRMAPAEAMRPEAPAHFRPGPLERLGLQRFMPLAVRVIMRSLERTPAKALLSILGLSLAVSLLIVGQYTFDALDEIIRIQFRTAQRDDVTLAFNEVRDMSAVHAVASLPGVLRVEPYNDVPVKIRFRHRFKKAVLFGLGHSRQLRMVLDENERPIDLPQEGMVLSKKLAETLGAVQGDKLTVESMARQRRTLLLTVARIVDEPIGMFAYMDNAALAKAMEEPETMTGAFVAVDPQQRATLYHALKSVPAVRSINLREATLQSFLSTIAENMRMNTIVIVAFACVIAVGVVYNSARIALSERAVELASLRILGFTRAEVARMLLGEQGLLTLAAIPFGCLLGYGLAALLSELLSQDLFRIPLVISTRTYLFSIGVVLLSAAASGYLVWRKVHKLDLIEVLKTRE